jgi:hypothetical protein
LNLSSIDLTALTVPSRSEFLAKITKVAFVRDPFVAFTPEDTEEMGENFSGEP